MIIKKIKNMEIKPPYIYVGTEPEKEECISCPVSIVKHKKLIAIPHFFSKDIDYAKTIAREHYENHSGFLPSCGEIKRYIYNDGHGSLYEIGLDNKIVKILTKE